VAVPAVAVPKSSGSGWGRAGHRRAVLIGAIVLAIILGGGVAAWAEVAGGNTQYRMGTVTRANIGTTLTVVGDVAPVSQASAAFQVAGQVATVSVTPGQQVTAGQSLATLDSTALGESVSSEQSTLDAAEAKLVEDEENQSSAAASNKSQNPAPSASTTTTTSTHNGSTGSGNGNGNGATNATVTQDQNQLTQDQATLSADQQQESADLTQEQAECTSAKTSTPAGQATCGTSLETLSADENQVSKDQETVSKDETALAQALNAEATGGSGGSTSSGGSGSGSPTQTGHALSTDPTNTDTGNTGTGTSGGGGNGSFSGGAGSTGSSGNSGSTNTDTPQQIASDQASIDTAEANLTEAEQSVNDAALSSPISGTVVSVGFAVGDTVSANSSSDAISIIGTSSYEVQATLDSTQVPSVKVGQSAAVQVDGDSGSVEGTVSQVGPVQSTSSGYDYPVVIALPSSDSGLHSGATADANISTGEVDNVVAVPTSAVQTLGSRTFVTEISKGELIDKRISIGMVGNTYTQVKSGLTPGQSVVLADYAEAVPSSNTNTNLGSFLGGGGGAGGFFGGGGAFFGGAGGGGTFKISRIGGAGSGGVNLQIGG
jgi:trimeric autotransporter adhesin